MAAVQKFGNDGIIKRIVPAIDRRGSCDLSVVECEIECDWWW